MKECPADWSKAKMEIEELKEQLVKKINWWDAAHIAGATSAAERNLTNKLEQFRAERGGYSPAFFPLRGSAGSSLEGLRRKALPYKSSPNPTLIP